MHSSPRTRAALAAAVVAAVLASACGGGDASDDADSTASAAALPAVDSSLNQPIAGTMSDVHAAFFMAAVDSSEVAAAREASARASDAQVKQYALELARDHARMLGTSRSLASRHVAAGHTSETGPALEVHQSHAQVVARLRAMPAGPAWDRAWLDAQVEMHQSALQRLQPLASATSSALPDSLVPPEAPGRDGASARPAAPVARSAPSTPAAAAAPRGRGMDSASAGGTATAAIPVDTLRATAATRDAARRALPVIQAHLNKAQLLRQRLAGTP